MMLNGVPGRTGRRASLHPEPACFLQSRGDEVRGLRFSLPVQAEDIAQVQIRDVLAKELDRDLPPEKTRQYARGYAEFGVIPKDPDLRQAPVGLMAESTAAFDDPGMKELKVLEAGAAEETSELSAFKKAGIDREGSVLVHELTAAARDQLFDLGTLPLDVGDNALFFSTVARPSGAAPLLVDVPYRGKAPVQRV